METNKNDRAKKLGGLLFVACLFLGLGAGVFMKNIKFGALIGLGIGFLALAAVRMKKEE